MSLVTRKGHLSLRYKRGMRRLGGEGGGNRGLRKAAPQRSEIEPGKDHHPL